MPAYPDEQLVMEALGDSRQAFEQLVEQHQYRVLRTIASIISDEQAAQDVAQETFLSAWSNLAKLKQKQKFGRWLNQIAINSSKLWLKDQKRHNENIVSIDDAAVILTQEPEYRREKLRQKIWDAIDELTEDHKEAVILHYISGYSYKEISEMLSVPISTVRGRLQEARNQLRKEFLDMVTQLQLEIDSTVHKFLKERAKQDGVPIEGLILRLIERYKRDTDRPGIAVRKVEDWGWGWRYPGGVSPDGRYFSFRSWRGNLVVRDLTTGEQRDITSDGDRWRAEPKRSCGPSTWSPDGKQIVYSWNDEVHSPYISLYNELRIIGLDGSKPRVLYRSEDPELDVEAWDWSQDGKFIVGRRGEPEPAFSLDFFPTRSDILLISVADGSVRTLKSLEGLTTWCKGSLSPDGRYVAYARSMEKNVALDVFLLATDGSGEEVRLVGHTDSNDLQPVWGPDGKSIVFVCNREPVGNSSLWLTRVADGKQMGEPQLVMKCAGLVNPHGFTREGSLYYSINSGPLADIYVASLNMETGEVESQPTRLRCEGNNGRPAWSPDGKSLAYLSDRYSAKMGHQVALVIRSMETGKEREFHPEAALSLRNTILHWSPDGRSILCGGNYIVDAYLVDVQAGHVTTIAEPRRGMTIEQPDWAQDGKTIFHIRRYPDKEWEFFSIVARDLATGEERELYTGGYSWCTMIVSPDGQELAFSDEDQKALKVIPTAGGEPRTLFDLQIDPQIRERDSVGPVTWTPDGRHLLFIKAKILSYDEQINELWRIPTEGGEPEKLRELELDKQLVYELRPGSFHPDGQRIAFRRSDGESQSEIWVMDNLLTTFAADK